MLALGSTSRLYRIDVATGAATAIGPRLRSRRRSPAPRSASTSTRPSTGSASRPTRGRTCALHPDTGATAAVDGTLTYAAGDAGAASTPRIVGSAYTNSVAGATTTQLYDLDAGRDVLALQNPPNNGTLVTVGSLGIDIGDNAGFDISAVDGVAYAAVQVGQSASSQLYTVNLTTGATTLVGRIGGYVPLRALAAVGHGSGRHRGADGQPDEGGRSTKLATLLRTGVRLRATCSEGCTLSATIRFGSRVVGSGKSVTTDLAGSRRSASSSGPRRRRSSRGAARPRSRSSSPPAIAAGNTATARQTLRARR